MPVEIGTLFSTFEQLKEAIQDWAVNEHFEVSVPIKDHTRVNYVCRQKKTGCPWRVYASRTRNNDIAVKKINDRHTCAGANSGSVKRDIANQQSWLRRVVPEHLFVSKSTEVHEIVDCIRINYSKTVTYESARLIKATLVNDRREHQCEQFKKVPSYLSLLHQKNSNLYTNLHTSEGAGGPDSPRVFQRVFICPTESRQSFIHMRKFLAVDGTFLKARFVQTLLLAVGIDGNGMNLLLAWAVVESENKSSWIWFLTHLKQAIPECGKDTTLISDRDKGLLAADQEVFGDSITRLICCFHLKGNLVKRFHGNVAQFFWAIADAKTLAEFVNAMQTLREYNVSAAEYLAGIDRSLWVTAFYTGKYYGHKTSNIVESMNKVLVQERELSILDLLNEIWHYTMNQRFKRYTKACEQERDQLHTNFCLQQLQENARWAQRNVVQMASATRGVVTQSNNRVFLVDLESRQCDCGNFQKNGIPCGHAFSCIIDLQRSPRSYVPYVFSIIAWKSTYLSNISPISLEGIAAIDALAEVDGIREAVEHPTKERKAMGRPQVKRMTPGSQRKKVAKAQALLNNTVPPPDRGKGSQACRKCGVYGHNRATCGTRM